MNWNIHARFAVCVALLLPACNQLERLDEDSEGGSTVPPLVVAAFTESCGKSGCHAESGPTAPVLAGANAIEGLIGSQYVTIGDLGASQIALQMLPDAGLAALGATRPNPLRMPLDGDYFNNNVYIILAWIEGAEFPDDEVMTGGTTTTGDMETTGDTSTTTGEPLEPTFANIQMAVLGQSTCSCHYGMFGSGGLKIATPDDLYQAIVGVPSVGAPDKNYIEPGDPANSYIYMKVTKAAGIVGSQMPLGPPLSADKVQLLEDWIAAGAMMD